VVRDGGDQPNVVPRTASVWYYFRETDYQHIKELFELGTTMAQSAAAMTGTTLANVRILGSAWPRHFNRPVAEAMHANIRQVGLPTWSADDHAFARAVQRELKTRETGLDTTVEPIGRGVHPDQNRGGGSDDIGEIAWVVPTVTLRFPSNIPGLPGHHWSNAIAMATPIAHKGATAGAKVVAMTMVDLLLQPGMVDSAWAYFRNVQTKDQKYVPFIRRGPARHRAEQRESWPGTDRLKPFYYDPAKHKTHRAAGGEVPGR
jgi:aminobenzoyl-glutamate utilization protein B